ncbi:Imm1 family immunity protein [Actinokineospora sp. HUAS TT18]|uniref:Imm1 family immunity protein n=1 Tax=Actinokineospora sp. HUAS TT18 TaxID=3447451 RepID=UPI003F524851
MALEIWYDQDSANDLGPGDPAIIVNTLTELDAFVDQVIADTRDHVAPPMVEVSVAGDPTSPVLNVGLGQDRGFIFYMTADGGWTQGDPTRTDTVTYVYAGSASEIAGSAEIPLPAVRDGLREFMKTGAKPRNIAASQ